MKSPPVEAPIINAETGYVSANWAMWFSAMWNVINSVDMSGITADRPIKGLYVGRPYFDTTINRPIWLKSVRPTVWVDSAGVAV